MPRKPTNPFTPSFGHVPFALAGRETLIDDVIGGLANQPGDPNRSTIFTGPRGSGKTVLLSAISDIASQQGWVGARATARGGMIDMIMARLQANAAHLVAPEDAAHITGVRLGPLGANWQAAQEGSPWYIRAENLIEDLNEQGVGVLFAIDEVDPHCEELIEFLAVFQDLATENREVALLLAGLPSNVSELLADRHVSFIRRSFQRALDSIPQIEVEEAMLRTIEENGRSISPSALAAAAKATGGFAFSIQLIGYYLWRITDDIHPMSEEDVRAAIGLSEAEMERAVFAPTLRELTPREVGYLQAMAADDGPSTTSEIARRMEISMTNASNVRRRLIEHGVISEVRLGQVQFEIPLLRDYLRSHKL